MIHPERIPLRKGRVALSDAGAVTDGALLQSPVIAQAARRRRRFLQRRDAVLRIGSVCLFFLAWEVFSHLNATVLKAFNPLLMPTPEAVIAAGVEMTRSGELIVDIVASLSRVVKGFLLGALVGVVGGVMVSRSRVTACFIEPIVDMLRPIPSLAFLPLLVLWLGIGEISKVVFISYAAFFPIFTTTVQGVRQIDPILLRAAASLGVSKRDMFFHVELPAASPSIITGLRLGFGISFFVIVAAEFVAADEGLGFLINDSRTFFEVPRMFLGAIVIGLIGFGFNVGLRALERRLLRWQQNARGN
jgi:ABC-type nitrate/sulfonate/bicarbonate transport system permease component